MFIFTGKPSKCPSHPDYAPSVFAFRKKDDVQALDRYNRSQQRRKRQREVDAASSLLQLSKLVRVQSEDNAEVDSTASVDTGVSSADAEVDTSLSADPSPSVTQHVEENEQLKHENIELKELLKTLQQENERMKVVHIQLHADNSSLKTQNSELITTASQLKTQNTELKKSSEQLEWNAHNLESEIKAVKFGAEMIKENNKATCFYTGLPTFALFLTLFNLLKAHVSATQGLTRIDEFFSVLVKLRLNLVNVDLAYRMGCSEATMSRVFHKWLDIMYCTLKHLIVWPDTDTLQQNLPECFRRHYRRVKCIIDCFEVFIERPVSLTARAITYSNYKKHNTAKVLIGIAPTGSITFISQAWGGRVSDKVITQQSGFLKRINPGDVVLADRGFNIHDELAIRGAKLEIPAFTRGKQQLSREEVEKTRQLARVRIHVERVIGQMRKKYKILQGTLPISLIKRPTDTDVATIDKIVTVSAALTNLCDPVL